MMNGCPDMSTWEELAAERTNAPAAQTLRVHLDGCPDCRATFDRLGSNEQVLESLRAVFKKESLDNRPSQTPRGDRLNRSRSSFAPRSVATGTSAGELAQQTSFEPGAMVAGCRIVGEVARSPGSTVYEAISDKTSQRVAIKVLNAVDPSSGLCNGGRFKDPIPLPPSLRHSSIVRVLEAGWADRQCYYVMPFVEGKTPNRFAADANLSMRERLRLLRDIALAVSHAHQHGVMHCNLKPANILVDDEGRPHVLDFGIGNNGSELHQRDASANLPAYVSPEQAAGVPGSVDVRTDVYSLGVLMYEMLTGAMPYPTKGTRRDVLRHVALTPARPPSSVTKNLGCDVEGIVLKALAKSPAQRYQSAVALADDIQRFLDGWPVEACRDRGWYVLRTTLRRYKSMVAAACLILVAGLAYGVTITMLYQDAVRVETPNRPQLVLADADMSYQYDSPVVLPWVIGVTSSAAKK